jgi:2-amino-4-hydroxy-6-hydroxymethyldihydropteridine diphosphokinase
VIKQDISENRVNIVYLALGSNLGNRIKNIEKAKLLLIKNNISLISVSKYYETASWPNPKNPKFINIVLKAKCLLNPNQLLNLCKSIEVKLGRKKTLKNSPRECDIDIIDFNSLILKGKLNLFEIEKTWFHRLKKKNIKTLIFSLSNKDIRSIKQI